MSVSIYDIAREAGVSACTVSNVLNNKGKLSQKTRNKVKNIAQELGYSVNLTAKTLRTSRSNTIGILVPNISNDYFSTLCMNIEEYLREKGYICYLCNTHNHLEERDKCLRNLIRNNASGIIVVAGLYSEIASDDFANIPIVSVDREPFDSNHPVLVTNDYYQMTYDAAEHLAGQGCKKIILLALDLRSETDALPGVTMKSISGFHDCLSKHGLPFFEPTSVFRLPGVERSNLESEALIHQLISNRLEFDGVVALGDQMAFGAMVALKQHGIPVPEKVKIVGIDNSSYSQYASPTISSISKTWMELAHTAVDCLLKMIEGETLENTTIYVGHTLMERESTRSGQR